MAVYEKYVYIVQGGHENRVLEVHVEDYNKVVILEEDEDGIISPNFVSVNTRGVIMVGMENNQSTATAYQIDYDVN